MVKQLSAIVSFKGRETFEWLTDHFMLAFSNNHVFSPAGSMTNVWLCLAKIRFTGA